MGRRQLHIERAERLREPIASPCADQWHDVVALCRHPGDCDLRRRRAEIGGNCTQRFNQRQVGVEIGALKARAYLAEILLAGFVFRPVPADQAA